MEGLQQKLAGLSLARRSGAAPPTYLLAAALQPGAGAALLAVSCSDFSVRLHRRDTLRPAGEFRGHGGPLCGLTWGHASPDLLYSGCADGKVRAWDVRRPGAAPPAQTFSSGGVGAAAHSYCSLDLNCSDALLAAGAERPDDDGDSLLVFWDARRPGAAPLGAFSESHADDVTELRFHPRDRDRLASGGADGLVNVFDLSRGDEDEALLATCRCGAAAGALCWSGPAHQQLLGLSRDEGLHLWDLDRLQGDRPLALFSAADARGPAGVDYLVGGAWLEGAGRLLVVGGTAGGDLRLMECDGGGLRPLRGLLRGGHDATVRCFLWDEAADALVTGGEDARLLLWKPGGAELGGGAELRGRAELGGGAEPRGAGAEPLKSRSALKSRTHRKPSFQKEKKKKT